MIRELDAEVTPGIYSNGQTVLRVGPIKTIINPDGARIEMNRVRLVIGIRETTTLIRANQKGTVLYGEL